MPDTTVYKTFESELRVRPDDIDMFRHVHNSKYFDYVLAARYDQMERCYGMSMESFIDSGFGWVVKAIQINYKRALTLGDEFKVQTSIENIDEAGCRVKFIILNKANNKVSCDGWFDFVMISMQNGKGVKTPADVITHYKSFVENA